MVEILTDYFEEEERMLWTLENQGELVLNFGFGLVCWIMNCGDIWQEYPM